MRISIEKESIKCPQQQNQVEIPSELLPSSRPIGHLVLLQCLCEIQDNKYIISGNLVTEFD